MSCPLNLSKFKLRPYKSPKRSETWHGANIGHEEANAEVKINLKAIFKAKKAKNRTSLEQPYFGCSNKVETVGCSNEVEIEKQISNCQ